MAGTPQSISNTTFSSSQHTAAAQQLLTSKLNDSVNIPSPVVSGNSIEPHQNLMNSFINDTILNATQQQHALLHSLHIENDTPLLSATEMHYTETFKRTQGFTPAQLSAFYQSNQLVKKFFIFLVLKINKNILRFLLFYV